MTIDERELSQSLHRYAHLEITDAALEHARESLHARLERRRDARRHAIVAAALVVVLTAGIGIYAWSLRGDTRSLAPVGRPPTTVSSPVITPSRGFFGPPDVIPRAGFIGFPPVGATPSTPERGTLVDSYALFAGALPWRGGVRLYADGRLIWYLFHGVTNSQSTGYLEQRLTPAGVELVRSQPDGAAKDPWHLEQWLPASAWADRTIRAYVPTRYAACAGSSNPNAPIEERVWGTPGTTMPRGQLLAMFPPRVADLLRDRVAVPPLDDSEDCLGLSTAEARLLHQALLDGGLVQDPRQNEYVLQYEKAIPGPPGELLTVRLEPVFPDGTVGCSSCG